MKRHLLSASALALILAMPVLYAAHAQTPAAPNPLAAQMIAKDDAIPTNKGNAVIHPIGHASVLITWDGKKILVDPAPSAMTRAATGETAPAAGGGRGAAPAPAAGAAAPAGGRGAAAAPAAPALSAVQVGHFTSLGTPDVVLITHAHGDHFNAQILAAVSGPNTVIGVPQAIYSTLSPELKAKSTIMANGDTSMLNGIEVQAVAMYNTTPERRNHPEGVGNGYVVTLGGKRFYFAGDTEETPELTNLPNIDVAFLPMNLPFTQTPDAAGAWVRNFKPKIVYPYHFSNIDISAFVTWAKDSSEVRLRKWY